MNVKINTQIPFFLWKMEERDADIDGNQLITQKVVLAEDEKTEITETYVNTIIKTPWWFIVLIKYLPIMLILITADWGYHLWNGIGLFFAAVYMLWFLWMEKNKPAQFYPVTISAIIILLIVGLLTGKLLYANHIVSDVIYLFLIKLLVDDYLFKTYNQYYSIAGKNGMFVYLPITTEYTNKQKSYIQNSLLGLAGISLIAIVINSAFLYKEYRVNQVNQVAWDIKQKAEAVARKSGKAEIIKTINVEENLTDAQKQLRKQLGIGVLK